MSEPVWGFVKKVKKANTTTPPPVLIPDLPPWRVQPQMYVYKPSVTEACVGGTKTGTAAAAAAASAPRNDPNEAQTSGASPALTVPLYLYWYLSCAYRKELGLIEKEFGVNINAEVSVWVTAADESGGDAVSRATRRFTDLVQRSTTSLQCVKVPRTQMESGIVREVVRNIDVGKAKMMINMAADQCLLFGPGQLVSGVEEQMEDGVELRRLFGIRSAGKDDCPLCLDKRSEEQKLRCGHEFCQQCLRDSVKKFGGLCPVCKATFGTLRGVECAGSIQSDTETHSGLRKAATEKESPTACPICLDKCVDKQELKCGHEFCRECLSVAVRSMGKICPVCRSSFGDLVGNQPKGTMTHHQSRSSLPGFLHCGSIEIDYHIPDGVQTDEHPNPGQRYRGTQRRAYLPDSPEGREVLQLLQRAFHQRLIFTVGTSITTGAENSVIWNDIHHKTSPHGGPQSYGFPDPNYLKTVKAELKAKGIE